MSDYKEELPILDYRAVRLERLHCNFTLLLKCNFMNDEYNYYDARILKRKCMNCSAKIGLMAYFKTLRSISF